MGDLEKLGRFFGDRRRRFEGPVFNQLCGNNCGSSDFFLLAAPGFHKQLWVINKEYGEKEKPDQRCYCRSKENFGAQKNQLVVCCQKQQQRKTNQRRYRKAKQADSLEPRSSTLQLGVFFRGKLVRNCFDDGLELQAAAPAVVLLNTILSSAIRTEHK